MKKISVSILPLILTILPLGAFFLVPQKAEAALTRTQRLVEMIPEAALPLTSSAFTPSNNSLLVVLIAFADAIGGNDAENLTVDGGGLTWSKRTAVNEADGDWGTIIWTAPVTTGASMQLTIAGDGTEDFELSIHAYDYTGYNVASPIGATAEGADVTTITLSGAPALTSEVIAVLGDDSGATSINAGGSGGFTELNDGYTGAAHGIQTQARTNSISTTVDWTVTGGTSRSAGAIEIKEEAEASPSRVIRLRGKVQIWGGVHFR